MRGFTCRSSRSARGSRLDAWKKWHLRMGFIDAEQVLELARAMGASSYATYLRRMVDNR